MARQRSGFYNTIEYIGPRPQKPKRPNFFGGWVILLLAGGIGFWFVRPWFSLVTEAQAGVSTAQADHLVSSLQASDKPGDRLAAAALSHSNELVTYDPAYFKIAYPNGDVPRSKGAAADVIVRCYRQIGIDLQKEVHEDMAANFRLYPQLFGATGTDTNIDHRRVPNLQRFFSRNGQELPPSRDAADYQPGDVVIWALANGQPHIGIVVPGPGDRATQPWIVHNMVDNGVKWENALFEYQIIGHYRYPSPDQQNVE